MSEVNAMDMIAWRRPPANQGPEGFLAAQIRILPPGGKTLSDTRAFAFGGVRQEGETDEIFRARLAHGLFQGLVESLRSG